MKPCDSCPQEVYFWYLQTNKSIITGQVNPTTELHPVLLWETGGEAPNPDWLVGEGFLRLCLSLVFRMMRSSEIKKKKNQKSHAKKKEKYMQRQGNSMTDKNNHSELHIYIMFSGIVLQMNSNQFSQLPDSLTRQERKT